MKNLLFILLWGASLNAVAVNPTQGPLQQDPSLCAYGYNPNCNQGGQVPQKIIRYTTINVPSKYGALAINKKAGGSGGAINMSSKAEAKREAIRRCENGGKNAPCEVVMWVRNGCIAGSQGKLGSKWKSFYAAREPGQAETAVLEQCKNSGASDCKIFVPEGCSIPDGMYN